MGHKLFTIGMEYEVERVFSQNVHLDNNNFERTSDASVQSRVPTITFRNRLVEVTDNTKRKIVRPHDAISGIEFVSRILDTTSPDFEDIIYNFLNQISKYENEVGERSGIHIHIGMGYNLQILKNLLVLGAHLEQVFFNLAGLGQPFRGLTNDSIYTRPITKFGPTVVKGPRGINYQCFNIQDCLEATCTQDFFYRHGDQQENHPDNKYIPIRYHWLSLYNLLTRGTVEFRIFNKTLNPKYLVSVIAFCKTFCEFAISNRIDQEKFPENSVYDYTSKDKVVDTLIRFASMSDFGNKPLEHLMMILKRTPFPILPKEYVYTHLLHSSSMRTRTHFDRENGSSYRPERINCDVSVPKYIDIHIQSGR